MSKYPDQLHVPVPQPEYTTTTNRTESKARTFEVTLPPTPITDLLHSSEELSLIRTFLEALYKKGYSMYNSAKDAVLLGEYDEQSYVLLDFKDIEYEDYETECEEIAQAFNNAATKVRYGS